MTSAESQSTHNVASDDMLEHASHWLDQGRQLAIATVVSTWGSSPRQAGSQLLIDDQGRFLGSVSGGGVEGAVIQAAEKVIDSGEPQLMKFGVSDDTAWEVGLACGGEIEVYVEMLA